MRKGGWCRTLRGRWISFTKSCGALIYCKKLWTLLWVYSVRFWFHVLLWCTILQGHWRGIYFLSTNIKRKEDADQTPPLPVTWCITAYPECGDQKPPGINEQRYRWGLEHVMLFYQCVYVYIYIYILNMWWSSSKLFTGSACSVSISPCCGWSTCVQSANQNSQRVHRITAWLERHAVNIGLPKQGQVLRSCF